MGPIQRKILEWLAAGRLGKEGPCCRVRLIAAGIGETLASTNGALGGMPTDWLERRTVREPYSHYRSDAYRITAAGLYALHSDSVANVAKIACGLRQVTGDMLGTDNRGWTQEQKRDFLTFVDRINGYAAELESDFRTASEEAYEERLAEFREMTGGVGAGTFNVTWPTSVTEVVERSRERVEAMLAAPAEPSPIPMILNCPACGARHIDEGEFATKPHHTHACQGCGLVWRPAKVPTVGVQFLPGYKNP